MARAILKFNEREMTIGEGTISFGRSTENTVPFPDNSNISRNHAEIGFKNGKFTLTDLGSSNGTTVNGQKVEGETVLNDGDFVTLGNSVIVEFHIEDPTPEDAEEDEAVGTVESQSVTEAKTSDEASKSKFPVVLGVTGAVCGLAIVFAVAAGFVFLSDRGSSAECDATARILSPINGENLSQETEVKVEVKNSACVSVVHVMLNGKSIADLKEEPYTAQLDPKNYPELADGGLYPLQVILEDGKGNTLPQGREVAIQIDTKAVSTPTPTITQSITPTPTPTQGNQPSAIEIQKMTATVVSKFTGGSFKYNLSNPEFLGEVRKRTAEYSAAGGYSQRAAVYRDMINGAFVRDKSLDPALPYILAMSRSKFTLDKQGANEGLWQMSNDFTNANAYNVLCTTLNLSEPTQECASKVAAGYLNDLMSAFDNDIVFTVASFGKTLQEANTWKATLPADRTEFWKIITDPAQRELVSRFFAAAVVTENPQKFGLKKDRPLSELYPTVGK